MSKLSLSNIIRVTLLAALRGLSDFNTSALSIFTSEVPIPGDFGDYRVYLDADGVAEDFGSNSDTYRLALSAFNQVPNIITGKGYLIVIPREQAASASPATIISDDFVDLTLLTASDYNLKAAVDGVVAADILIGSVDTTSLATALADLNSTAITAAGLVFTLDGEVTSARVTLKTVATGVAADIATESTATGTDILPVIQMEDKTVAGTDAGLESIKDAILRMNGAVEFFGIIYDEKMTDAILTETAATVQSMDKIQFVGSNLSADIAGIFTTLKDSGYTHTRCLYYSISENNALDFAAGYASRGLSINFDADNTALTMHGKDIVGLVGDSGMTQTLLTQAGAAGVDFYGDFGVPKVFTSGANGYFDKIYTDLAFKLKLIVAGFNYIMTTSTKIVQTEPGMNGLKKAYREVCKQFVRANVFAPGTWTGSTRFGDPEIFNENIEGKGFYIYSAPISQQSSTERLARIAQAVQIAAKASGAIHSSDVIVFSQA